MHRALRVVSDLLVRAHATRAGALVIDWLLPIAAGVAVGVLFAEAVLK